MLEGKKAAADARIAEKREQVDQKREKGKETWGNFTTTASRAINGMKERAGRVKDRAVATGERVVADVTAAPARAQEIFARATTSLELKITEAVNELGELDDRAEEKVAKIINAAAGRLESLVISGSARWKEFRAEQQGQAADRARNALDKKMEARQSQAKALREEATRMLQRADQIEQTPGSSEAGLAEKTDRLTISSGETRAAADAARAEAAVRRDNAKSVEGLVGWFRRHQ